MEELIEIFVDGRNMQVRPDISLLQALKDNDIGIPALCYNPKLEPYGGCGLCLIEAYVNGVWKLHRACLTMTEEGSQIRTGSDRILKLRARAARMLLKRGPFMNPEPERLLISLINQAEAKGMIEPGKKEYKEKSAHFENPGCILCGLCVRICGKIGKNRLMFLGRGKNLRVGAINDSRACGRCRACQQVCPTGFIKSSVEPVFTVRLYK